MSCKHWSVIPFKDSFRVFYFFLIFWLSITGLLGVAQLGSIWNLPVFSWVSDLLDFKDKDKYTTLVRLSGPLFAICKYIMLRY